jgi:hypothetical protein
MRLIARLARRKAKEVLMLEDSLLGRLASFLAFFTRSPRMEEAQPMCRFIHFPSIVAATLLLTMTLAEPVNAAMPRVRSPFFSHSRMVVPPQLRGFFNSPNFRVQFQPLGGGARVFTLSNGAMTARLMTQPLGGGARVITFMDGATQARLVFQPLGGGARVLSFTSTGNITAHQLLFLTGSLNRNFTPVTSAFNPWMSGSGFAGSGLTGFGSGSAGFGSGSGGSGSGSGGSGGVSISSPSGNAGEILPSYSIAQPSQTAESTVFDALGLPTQGGQLAWPIGLRILPPDPATKALRREIESDLLRIVQQAAASQDSATSVKQTHDDIRQLRQALNEKGFKLSEGMVAEAKRFLNQLDHAAENGRALKPAYDAAASGSGN